MKFRFAVVVLLVLAGALLTHGQTKRPKRAGKLPLMRESMTVKGNLSQKENPANEADPGVWRRFDFAEHRLSLELPAARGDAIENEVPDLEGVWTYAADTERAAYRMIVRDLPTLMRDDAVTETLDAAIKEMYDSAGETKLKVLRNISYEGRPGREFIVEEKNKVQAIRIFLLEKKLYVLFVTVKSKADWPRSELWVMKFFKSFKVELSVFNEA